MQPGTTVSLLHCTITGSRTVKGPQPVLRTKERARKSCSEPLTSCSSQGIRLCGKIPRAGQCSEQRKGPGNPAQNASPAALPRGIRLCGKIHRAGRDLSHHVPGTPTHSTCLPLMGPGMPPNYHRINPFSFSCEATRGWGDVAVSGPDCLGQGPASSLTLPWRVTWTQIEPTAAWSPGRGAEVSGWDPGPWGSRCQDGRGGDEGIWRPGDPLRSSRIPSPRRCPGVVNAQRTSTSREAFYPSWGWDSNPLRGVWGRAGVGRALHLSGGGWNPELEMTQGLA